MQPPPPPPPGRAHFLLCFYLGKRTHLTDAVSYNFYRCQAQTQETEWGRHYTTNDTCTGAPEAIVPFSHHTLVFETNDGSQMASDDSSMLTIAMKVAKLFGIAYDHAGHLDGDENLNFLNFFSALR